MGNPKINKKTDLSDLLVYYCFSTHWALFSGGHWAVECIGYRDSNRCAPEHSDSNHCSPLKSPKTQWFESRLPLWETPKSTKEMDLSDLLVYYCFSTHQLGLVFWWAVECIGHRDSNRCVPEHSDSNHCSPLKSPKTQWFESRLPLIETPKSTKKQTFQTFLFIIVLALIGPSFLVGTGLLSVLGIVIRIAVPQNTVIRITVVP